MLTSMTGFGSVQAEIQGVEFSVEIRSVNNRYFKLSCKLPETWASLETEIEKLVREKITRGSVSLAARVRIPDDQAAYTVNTAALMRYIEQLRIVEVEVNPAIRLDLASLLQLPGVCTPPALEDLCDKTRDGLEKLVRKAIESLLEMRRHEGKALRAELLSYCDSIERELAGIATRSPDVVKEYHERLRGRVQELTEAARVNIDADTLAREVAIYAERCDIAEEIARLGGHLKQFRGAVDSPEPAGRKLDFIAQEMLREANTIASKSNDVAIAQAVVEIKTAIDRIKEQSANAE